MHVIRIVQEFQIENKDERKKRNKRKEQGTLNKEKGNKGKHREGKNHNITLPLDDVILTSSSLSSMIIAVDRSKRRRKHSRTQLGACSLINRRVDGLAVRKRKYCNSSQAC